jgi:preprotein translocase subunit SecD
VRNRRRLWVSLVGILLVAFGSLAATVAAGYSPALGLDLQGGASVVLQPTEEVPDEILEQAISIIRNRVDGLGVAEPEIARQGQSIIVQLPGVADRQRALEVVGQTAELRFRPVLQAGLPPDDEAAEPGEGGLEEAGELPAGVTTTTLLDDPEAPETEPAPEPDPAAGGADAEGEGADEAAPAEDTPAPAEGAEGEPAEGEEPVDEPAALPTTAAEDDEPEAVVVLPHTDGSRYQLGPTRLRGDAVATAQARVDEFGTWTVNLEMTEEGIEAFNELAAECHATSAACPPAGIGGAGEPRGAVAIVLDGVVQSAPTINEPQFERDRIQISGGFTDREARDLALVLRFGALPVELEPQTVQTVSATLGRDSLRAGLIAGMVGLGLVALYMLVYYRLLGLVAILSLAVSASLLLAVISYLGETTGLALTLAGITGIVVSIGVAVDSNVVYYERLKESVLRGGTMRSATDRGFKRAFSTILRADAASLIGAALLYYFTVGPVRGFAFYLGLATIIDVVTSYFFMRPAVILLGRSPRFGRPALLGVPRRTTGLVPAGAGGGS